MKGLLIHYIIGISAAILAVAGGYFIYSNPKNLISASIIILAGLFVSISQYQIIRGKKK